MKIPLLVIGSVLILIGEYLVLTSLVSENQMKLVGFVLMLAGLVAIIVASKRDAAKNALLAVGGGLMLNGIVMEISSLALLGHIGGVGILALFVGLIFFIVNRVIAHR
ncbi:MAG: hypothetical protein QOJ64_1202 [Acidobacteriota bacterium]|jgi:hypothetical protein|nr:hypothetical protein [Acidobacteriota bacterium]